jgi:hypothetical protein
VKSPEQVPPAQFKSVSRFEKHKAYKITRNKNKQVSRYLTPAEANSNHGNSEEQGRAALDNPEIGCKQRTVVPQDNLTD